LRDPHFFKGSIWLGVSDARILAADGCNIHPHNYWLDVTVSGGLVGLAMFAGLAVLWLRRISRNLVPDIEPMRFAVLIATVVALWPIASTSSLFVADTGGWIVLTIGWVSPWPMPPPRRNLALVQQARPSGPPNPSRSVQPQQHTPIEDRI